MRGAKRRARSTTTFLKRVEVRVIVINRNLSMPIGWKYNYEK